MDRRQFIHGTVGGAAIFAFAPMIHAAEHFNPNVLLERAIETNNSVNLKLALAFGADPNHFVFDSVQDDGEIQYQSALLRATALDHPAQIDILLKNGADIRTRYKQTGFWYDQPALMLARSTQACDLLIEGGANIKEGDVTSVLYPHVLPENPLIFDHLLSKGADINALNNCGQTLLSIMVSWGFSIENLHFVKARGGLESHQVGGSISPSRPYDPLDYEKELGRLRLLEREGLIEKVENYFLFSQGKP